ncbi:MAG: 2-hydroxyacid dehydrogenase [Saprospiraceae bacterium]
MTITLYSAQSYDKIYFDRFNTTHKIVYQEARLNEQTAGFCGGSDAVCLFVNDHANADTIRQMAKQGIRLIALRCAGFNNIDLAVAKECDIPVVRVPAYSPHAIAEHAVALILTLDRKTHKAYNRVREGNFSLERLTGFDLFGKTVGVVGTGKIGAVFCEIMLGFGCKVQAFDVVENELLQAKGVRYIPLPQLLMTSDIVSLHCPLHNTTRHLINAASLAAMKTGSMLINTGRGALIDSVAVIGALRSGKLGYLGIDVYEQEENLFALDLSDTIIPDELILQLMAFPNVLITAHQAYFTEEALSEIARITLENVDSFTTGSVLKNQISI